MLSFTSVLLYIYSVHKKSLYVNAGKFNFEFHYVYCLCVPPSGLIPSRNERAPPNILHSFTKIQGGCAKRILRFQPVYSVHEKKSQRFFLLTDMKKFDFPCKHFWSSVSSPHYHIPTTSVTLTAAWFCLCRFLDLGIRGKAS